MGSLQHEEEVVERFVGRGEEELVRKEVGRGKEEIVAVVEMGKGVDVVQPKLLFPSPIDNPPAPKGSWCPSSDAEARKRVIQAPTALERITENLRPSSATRKERPLRRYEKRTEISAPIADRPNPSLPPASPVLKEC